MPFLYDTGRRFGFCRYWTTTLCPGRTRQPITPRPSSSAVQDAGSGIEAGGVKARQPVKRVIVEFA